MRFAVALSALALAITTAAAKASVVTDVISFNDVGTYGVGGSPWNGSAVASGSFDITFNPDQLYLTQSISGFITNLTYSVTDGRFAPASLTFPSIASFEFAYDGAGTLTLYSDATLAKDLNGTANITIGINGWAYTPAADVWYSQSKFGDTLTTSGGVSISQTPLPGALALFVTGLMSLGAMSYRKRLLS